MIHPDTVVKIVNDQIGYGVFATAFIPKGTITFVRDTLDIIISPQDYEVSEPQYRAIIDKYTYQEGNGSRVLSWDHAKYVNHSCRPNAISTGYGFEIAIRDIEVGEEMTDEYGIFNIEQNFRCYCCSPDCRGIVRVDDLDRYAARWDEIIKDALGCFHAETQPLLRYITSDTYSDLMRYLNTGNDYASILTQKYIPVMERAEVNAALLSLS
ncbi:MAG: SET domain-containing protein-lysine N-methyltransferase [Deltaproteobacteria bacterium]|nr:SET domain-containing protein-lysine N-methyltransferase [Deltaproteobacteria bacterium]